MTCVCDVWCVYVCVYAHLQVGCVTVCVRLSSTLGAIVLRPYTRTPHATEYGITSKQMH